MSKQVEKSHYEFFRYNDNERWFSYWLQLSLLLKSNVKSILEIGIGAGVVGDYIKKNTKEIKYVSLDFDQELKPDIVGDILNVDIPERSYDVVCAFEVLEHFPIDKSFNVFTKMCNLANDYVIFSVPHWGRYFGFEFYLPFIKRINFGLKLNSLFPPVHIFNGQHYWEVGKKGYSNNFIKKYFYHPNYVLVNEFVHYNNPYHHFYVYKRK